MTNRKPGLMGKLEAAVLLTVVVMIASAMLVLIAVEIFNCVNRYQSSVLIQDDVKHILHSGSGSGIPSLSDASQKDLADLVAIQKNSQESGTVSFLYTLTIFAIITVCAWLYKRAVDKVNEAQGLLDEHRRSLDEHCWSVANLSEAQAAVLSLTLAEGIAVQIGQQGTVALTRIAPVMRDCINEIDNSLQNMKRNRGAISPVLYDGMRNGIGRVRTCLSNIARAGGATEIKDILDKVKDLCGLMDSKEFSEICRRDLGSATEAKN